MAEMYLQMGRLILVFVLLLCALGFAQLLIEYGAEHVQERIERKMQSRRANYRRVAKRHGRIVR